MKVIKRDGRAVDFDRNKIEIAISKANEEVRPKDKATKAEIKEIIDYVLELDRKRILVEDIQDIIEEKLMSYGHYELAKKYIVYRYTRALVRKSNSTDQSILGLIKNQNRITRENGKAPNSILASNQRNLIAGEVSKDLTKRILLPEKISKADEEGILYFHDKDYYLQPIFNSSIIDYSNMLEEGIIINNKKIKKPNTFLEACSMLAQIMAVVSDSQYGGQTYVMSHLGKYLAKSRENILSHIEKEYGKSINEEISQKMLQEKMEYEINIGLSIIQNEHDILMATNEDHPEIVLFINLCDEEYIEENAEIVQAIFQNEINNSVKNQILPKIIYVLDENNNLNGGKYDYLTKLAIECNILANNISYVSAKVMKKLYNGQIVAPMGEKIFGSLLKDKDKKYKTEGRFDQGIVTINLVQCALSANGDEKIFWQELEERLSLCYDALMCRHYALLGTTADVSPIHWIYGGICRKASGEKIDEYLKNEYSTLSLGYMGINEAVAMLLKEKSNEEKEKLAIKILEKLKSTVDVWKKESSIAFILYATSSKNIGKYFAETDRDIYGIVKGINDKEEYSNSFYLSGEEDLYKRLSYEETCQELSQGGAISEIKLENDEEISEKIEELIKYIYENVKYVKLSVK